MMNKLLTIIALSAVSASHAAVSFDVQAETLRDSSGAAMVTTGLVMLVASTTDASFGTVQAGASLAVNSAIDGADDRIIAKWDLVLNDSAGTLADVTPPGLDFASFTGWGAGDKLALMWFPSLTINSTTTVANAAYGLYTPAAGLDSSDAWVTPADNASGHKLYFFTPDSLTGTLGIAGTNPASASNASLSVGGVPEPSRVMLLGLALLGMFVRRRR